MTIQEARWNELSADHKKHVIDVREPSEIGENDWKKITDHGGEVLLYPLSKWRTSIPPLAAGQDYVISCAHGVRSRTAATAWASGHSGTFISLAGGYEGIRSEMA